MKLTPDQLQTALEAFLAALPDQTIVTVTTVVPRVGSSDTEAGSVSAIVLADTGEDAMRFQQIIERGLRAYQDEPGLVASFMRTSHPEIIG